MSGTQKNTRLSYQNCYSQVFFTHSESQFLSLLAILFMNNNEITSVFSQKSSTTQQR